MCGGPCVGTVCLSFIHLFGLGLLCVPSDVFHFVSVSFVSSLGVSICPTLKVALPFVPISCWSLLVSSLLLGSGWGGRGDFGSYVFVA